MKNRKSDRENIERVIIKQCMEEKTDSGMGESREPLLKRKAQYG